MAKQGLRFFRRRAIPRRKRHADGRAADLFSFWRARTYTSFSTYPYNLPLQLALTAYPYNLPLQLTLTTYTVYWVNNALWKTVRACAVPNINWTKAPCNLPTDPHPTENVACGQAASAWAI